VGIQQGSKLHDHESLTCMCLLTWFIERYLRFSGS